MQPHSVTFADPAAERLLREHLNAVDAQLLRAGSPADVRRQILDDLLAQVRDTVWVRGGAQARADDVAAVLAELDPPEAYGGPGKGDPARGIGTGTSTAGGLDWTTHPSSPGSASRASGLGESVLSPPSRGTTSDEGQPYMLVHHRLLKHLVWTEIVVTVLAFFAPLTLSGQTGRGGDRTWVGVRMTFGLLLIGFTILAWSGLLRRKTGRAVYMLAPV